jgi:hypothetical protein
MTSQIAQVELTRSLDYGAIDQVFEARLEEAVQVGMLEDAPAVLAMQVHVCDQCHVILRERAGLVGTQNVHCTEVLEGVELLDDCLVSWHGYRAASQIRVHDHWQHLWRQADGNCDGKEERFHPQTLRESIDKEDDRHHDQHEADEQPADLVDSAVEGSLRPPTDQLPRRRAEVCVPPGSEHHGLAGAADDTATHEKEGGLIQRTHFRLPIWRSPGTPGPGLKGYPLLNRHGLACQSRLRDEQVPW